MNPLVSIIMPAYRCEEFIEESVKSICDQTYREWELIIVKEQEAGSIDEAIRKISDVRIRVVALETGAGLTAAFAEG
ncbi:MAG: glycosyltransferase [Firmicutes bacterium]|nr:glycosyltransferase [Bacillota bacterium]